MLLNELDAVTNRTCPYIEKVVRRGDGKQDSVNRFYLLMHSTHASICLSKRIHAQRPKKTLPIYQFVFLFESDFLVCKIILVLYTAHIF